MTELSEVFWMTVLGTSAGIIGLIIKKMSASKCDDISCFGIHIHRRVELETDNDEENVSEHKKTTSYSL